MSSGLTMAVKLKAQRWKEIRVWESRRPCSIHSIIFPFWHRSGWAGHTDSHGSSVWKNIVWQD